MGDAMTLVMLANGDDPTKVTDKSFNAAFNRIKKAVDNGQIRQFTGNDYAPPLAKGDLAAAMSWSGDIAQIGNKHIHWNVPKDGGAIWTDNMLIPKGGDVYTASVYMNYVYDPKVAGPDGGRRPEDRTSPASTTSRRSRARASRHFDPPRSQATRSSSRSTKMLDSVHIFDNAALNNEKYLTTWQQPRSRASELGSSTVTGG